MVKRVSLGKEEAEELFPLKFSRQDPPLEDESNDRISALPEHVLRRIISFLPLLDALRVAPVARAWRRLWTSVPNLDLDFDTHVIYTKPTSQPPSLNAAAVADGIDWILSLYDAPRLRRFRFNFMIDVATPAQIDGWIRFALDRGAEEVGLHIRWCYRWPRFLFENGSPSLKVLNLWGGIIEPLLPPAAGPNNSLRRLNLKEVSSAGAPMGSILSGCPLLEWLQVESSLLHWGDEEVKAPSLTTLHITFESCAENSPPLKIHAPKIRTLVFTGWIECFSFTCTPFPANVELFIVSGGRPLPQNQHFNKLQGDMRRIKSLSVCYATAKLSNDPRDKCWLEELALRVLNSFSNRVVKVRTSVFYGLFKIHQKQYYYDAVADGWILSWS